MQKHTINLLGALTLIAQSFEMEAVELAYGYYLVTFVGTTSTIAIDQFDVSLEQIMTIVKKR